MKNRDNHIFCGIGMNCSIRQYIDKAVQLQMTASVCSILWK